MKIGPIEVKKYKIEVMSPVHIASGSGALSSYQYLYDRQKQMVYFLNEKKWAAFLCRKNLLDKFANYAGKIDTSSRPSAAQYDALSRKFGGRSSNNQRKPVIKDSSGLNTYEWLLAQGIKSEEIETFVELKAKASENTMKGEKGTLNDVVRTSCQIDGLPYIPGSSIKGALRTGILAGLISRSPQKYNTYWQKIKNIAQDKNVNKKREFGYVVKDLEACTFNLLKYESSRPNPAICDVMKGLQVSDAICSTPKDTVVLQKIDVSTKKDKSGNVEKGLPVFRECIAPGTVFQATLSIDERIFSQCGIHSLEEILSCQREFIQRVLALQERIFGRDMSAEFRESEMAELILGGGTGFLTKTVILALAPNDEEAKDVIKLWLEDAFRKHKHIILDKVIAPRTMKITRIEGRRQFMGLCRISEED